MTARRIAVTMAAAMAAVLGVSSIAWACVTAQGPYVHDLFTRRAPVGQDVTVQGGGWDRSRPVEVDWRLSSAVTGQHLSTATVDQAGGFTTVARVPEAASGFYYISVSQGPVTKSVPFEIIGGPAPAAAASVAPAAGARQQWSGLRDADSNVRGVGDVASTSSDAGDWPAGTGIVAAVVVAGLVGLVGCVAVERRRLARVRSRS